MMRDEHIPAHKSRRERPAKPALTRQGIIDVALTILRDEGLSKVTMRRIAEALDTGAASLYVYVRNTADLHAQILDALLATISQPRAPEGTWQDRIKQLLEEYMRVLFEYPEIARMTLITHPSGPNYMALAESVLACMQEGGVPDKQAVWGVDMLFLYATAIAAEHSTRESSEQAAAEDSALANVISTADPSTYPHIARLGRELLSGTGPERFNWGIEALLTGILHTPRAVTEQEQE